ncbi:MAG: hypothetical protein EPN34_10340 [Burkholderiaceae bacterium]|nr:MAG: hypothetical protein EPN34_10340 [Burkholderiaceae bacterium]
MTSGSARCAPTNAQGKSKVGRRAAVNIPPLGARFQGVVIQAAVRQLHLRRAVAVRLLRAGDLIWPTAAPATPYGVTDDCAAAAAANPEVGATNKTRFVSASPKSKPVSIGSD